MAYILGDSERKILEMMSRQLLVTRSEIAAHLGKALLDGEQYSVNRLVDMGYVEKVESLGTCYVITQAGIRAMKQE